MNNSVPSLRELKLLGPDEAAAMFVEGLQRDEPGELWETLQVWRALDEANEAAWQRAREVWLLFEQLDDDSLADLRAEALAMRPGLPRRVPTWLAITASIAACITVVLLNLPSGVAPPRGHGSGSARQDFSAFGSPDFETSREAAAVDLPDGTRVALAPRSAIDLAFDGRARMVRLSKGSARFRIAPVAGAPFRVAAGGRIITDIGTEFEVAVGTDRLSVSLFEGGVEVRAGDDPRGVGSGAVTHVQAGQRLTIVGGGSEVVTQMVDNATAASALVQFNRTPLADAVDMINRHGRPKIAIRDRSIAALEVSGAFRTGDPERFARTLAALHPIAVGKAPDGSITLTRRR